MHLIVVDTSQIQSYIFGSNRLPENIGASHLVAQATCEWGFQVLDELRLNHNVSGRLSPDTGKRIEEGELDAEVLYSGGGNLAVVFRDTAQTQSFIRSLSLKALQMAPGLRLIIGQATFEWSESLAEALERAFNDAFVQKHSQPLFGPLLGLGITMMCRSTGLPAVGLTDSAGVEEGYPAAAEIHAKLKVIAEADDRLRHFLPLPEDYEYPKDLDDLGRSRGESSYIAVVHADGDGTAQYMRSIGKRYGSAQQNRAYIEALREFSAGITATAQTALQKTLEKLIVAIKGEKIQHPSPDAAPSIVPIKLKRSKRGKLLLAFRPIVFAGDDITFVSDGRIGLSLAIEYLHQFEASSKIFLGKLSGQEPTKYLTSSAGVAIVKSHYPFARSYHLSEALSRSAKEYRRKMGSGSFIDWHFASTGIVGELAEIRETEYQVGAGSLTLRPVGVEGNLEEEVRAWPAIHRVIEDFQTSEVWTGRRNKLKALRSALREGPEAVERFLTLYDLERLPELRPGYHDFQKRGWHGRLCGYFDAIELADHFIPCSSKENMAGTAASPQD